jgi:hypothetical protein
MVSITFVTGTKIRWISHLLVDARTPAIYVGGFKDGKSYGKGTEVHQGGTLYFGEFKDGLRHGKCVETFEGTRHPDGLTYVGQWKNGLPDGKWTFTHPDGRIFPGEWRDGEYHCFGKSLPEFGDE